MSSAATVVDPAWESPRPAPHPGFTDSITFAFGDLETDVFGVARVGLSGGQGSGLGVLFSGREPIAARAAGGIEADPSAWESIDAGGVTTTVAEPLRAWQVAFVSEDATTGFDLRFEAVSAPAYVPVDAPVGVAGGMTGYEQLCRVTGSVRARGGERRVDCLGQRGHSWGTPDWEKMELVRSVGAWLGDDLAVSMSAIRGVKAKHHSDEVLAATLFTPADESDLAAARDILEPRLSTTYDDGGRQRRASFELYETEESWPRRGAGAARCGTTLDLGRLRLECAFFRWEMEGRSGVGRYDILRRA